MAHFVVAILAEVSAVTNAKKLFLLCQAGEFDFSLLVCLCTRTNICQFFSLYIRFVFQFFIHSFPLSFLPPFRPSFIHLQKFIVEQFISKLTRRYKTQPYERIYSETVGLRWLPQFPQNAAAAAR